MDESLLGPKSSEVESLTPEKVTLVGKYCTVETFDETQHLSSLFHSIKAPELWTFVVAEAPKTETDFRQFFESRKASNYFYVVKKKGEEKCVGLVALMQPSVAHKSVQIGYFRYDPDIQRTVVTTEVFYLMLRHTFQYLKYNRIEWQCDKLNQKSKYAAERFGFQYEGCFREHRTKKTEKSDTLVFSILAQEWTPIREQLESWLGDDNIDDKGMEKRKLRLREVRVKLTHSE